MILEDFHALRTGPFGISRALPAVLRSSLLALPGAQELPFVRGRTVIPTHFGQPVVVGHPNYFGLFEGPPWDRLACVTGRWSNLRPLPPDATVLASDESLPGNEAEDALDRMRNLAKRLRQIPGVHLAFKPQSPVLVLLIPRAEALRDTPGIEILTGVYPELPGGIRMEFDEGAFGVDLNRYAATVEQIISQEA